MKNTLAVSLILGSFMIVFIHSHFRTKLPGGKPKLYELTLQVSTDPYSDSDRYYISMYYDKFPDKPITKKPLEVRQGKGKGNVEYWVAPIQPGRVLYEIQGVTEEQAREAFRLAAAKLAVKTTFVKRSVL